MTRAAGIRSQIGVQSDASTPATATVQLPGLLTMRHAPNRALREEYRNSWGGSNTYDDLRLESTGTYAGRCTSSTLIYWLASSLRGDETPSTVGTTGKEWGFNQPLSTASAIPDPKYLTAYWGDAEGGALRAPGVVCTRIVIEGADDAAWTVRCDLLGMGVIAGTFASLSTIANESVKNLLSKLYVETSWAALDAATVPVTGLAYGFTWTWDSGITGDFTMSGQLNRTDVHRNIPSATLQLRMKWNSDAAGYAVDMVNLTTKFIKIVNEGTTIAGGTAKNTIDIGGSYEPVGPFETITDQRDGTTRSTWDLTAVEDTARKVEVRLINALATL